MISLSPDDIRKYMMDCLLENKLDPGMMDCKETVRDPTEQEENCFLACMDKKIGLLRNDGTYNEDVILSAARTPDQRSSMKRKFDEIVNKCKLEAGDDICKLAGCVNRQPYDFHV